MREKTYHFYFDEGGYLGFPTICITSKKMKYKNSKYDSHITNYYFGKLSERSIFRVLELFVQTFKIESLNNHDDTQCVITLKEIEESIACPIG